jgi:hypothetical protein
VKKNQRSTREAAHGRSHSPRAGWLSRNGRGIALDVVVIVCNLFLLARLARVLREGGQGFLGAGQDAGWKVSPDVGWLFLSVFAAYTIGIGLKRAARQAGLNAPASGAYRPTSSVVVFAVCALLVLHFFIFLALLITGWQSTVLERLSPIFGSGTAGYGFFNFVVRFVVFIFILPLPTGLTLLWLFVGRDAPGSSAAPAATLLARPAVELVADLLLYFSVVVITLILNVLIAPRFVNVDGASASSVGGALASLVPLALAFSVFYLAPRLVYLAEDYRSPLAWLTIVLALLSLAFRTFFPGAI